MGLLSDTLIKVTKPGPKEFLLNDGDKAHYVALSARDEPTNYPTGAVVEVHGSAEVRAADRNIVAPVSDGLYCTDHHLAVAQGQAQAGRARRKSWRPMLPAGSPAPGRFRGARGRGAMEGACRSSRTWPPVRRAEPGLKPWFADWPVRLICLDWS